MDSEEEPTAATDALPPPLSEDMAPGLNLPADTSIDAELNAMIAPPKTPEQIENEVRQEAFEAAAGGLLPMRPNEIRQIRERYDETQQAAKLPIYPYPRPEIAIENISLDPGSTPMVIKTALGHVTTLNVIDATGAPWPIGSIAWAGDFEIAEPAEGANMITITPLSEYAHGNISMTVVGMRTPISFTIETHREAVQYRLDARLPMAGPFAKPALIQNSGPKIEAGSDQITAVLLGTPPDSAKRLFVAGTDARTTAYDLGGEMYLRSPLTLLSPSWRASASSGDGMNVYVMKSAPVILMSDRGVMTRISISETYAEARESDLQ